MSTQVDTNPYPYSDTNKRYFTYDYYLKSTFGGKIAKLSLDAGFSCPNLDGTCGVGGCIYCSERGSGDFAPNADFSIKEQIRQQKINYEKKWKVCGYIAYFQAHSNTYAPLSVLKEKYEEALLEKDVVGINIATRPDCLTKEILSYINELSFRTTVTIEIGLQSSNDQTLNYIHRGHDYKTFCQAFQQIRKEAPNVRIGTHIIFGLPTETKENMIQTIDDLSLLHPDEIKIHLLHVLKRTEMENLFKEGTYIPLERNEYIQLVCDALERIPEDIVIGRLTGDGKQDDLLAPLWSTKKTTIVNDIDKELFSRNSYQGIFIKKN